MVRIITVFLLFPALGVMAQDRDPLTLRYGISGLEYNDTSARAKQFEIKVRLPVYQKERSLISGSIGYTNTVLDDFPDNYGRDLHGITLQAAWLYRMTGKRSLMLFAQAGLFSDLEDISHKDFRYTMGLRYRYRHSDKLTTGWGLAYSRQFFGNQIIPFIDVDYHPNDKWSITGQFPVKPRVLYHFNPKISAGIELNGEAASYRLSEVEKSNQFIQINQWTGLAKMEYQFLKAWRMNLGLGRSFRQNYRLYEDASTSGWTIITFPIGTKPDPVQKIDSKGLQVQAGLSFNPF